MALVQGAVDSDSRGLMWPASDGQPTHIPATGMTRCGSFSISLTFAEWSRITLIGQVPRPHRVGGGNEGRQHDAGIDRGVEELVEMIVGNGLPRIFEISGSRRPLARNTRNAGAVRMNG